MKTARSKARCLPLHSHNAKTSPKAKGCRGNERSSPMSSPWKICHYFTLDQMPDNSCITANSIEVVEEKDGTSLTTNKVETPKKANLPLHLQTCAENENDGRRSCSPKGAATVHIKQEAKEMSPSSAISKLTISTKQTKTTRARRKLADSLANKLVTDYFPVRRSERKCRSKVIKEKQQEVEELIRSGQEEGLMVKNFVGKGRGVVATKFFRRGDFVVEYAGELISRDVAKAREKLYATDENTGCYMYYFTFRNKQYCIDATAETDRLGRLVNHSRSGNLCTKTFVVDDKPHLVLIANSDVQVGEEVLYDYGDRSKTSLKLHPWLLS